jgi:hypothetical protein
MPSGTAMPARTGLRWHWLRAGERGSAVTRRGDDSAAEHRNQNWRDEVTNEPVNKRSGIDLRTSALSLSKRRSATLRKRSIAASAKVFPTMRLDNPSSRAGTIDIPKIP